MKLACGIRMAAVVVVLGAGIWAQTPTGVLGQTTPATTPKPSLSAAVLLEKGIHLEETAGDLPGAIPAYEQAIAEAAAAKSYAAQALYRLGSVYLKQRQFSEAARVFGRLRTEYPEQMEWIGKAEKRLAEARGQMPAAEVVKMVDTAVGRISKMAETDPQLPATMAELEGLNQTAVVQRLAELTKAKVPEERRAAIYLLWKGPVTDISKAVPALQEALKNDEGLTRGMAAIALAGRQVVDIYPAIVQLAKEDKNTYARAMAMYALALMGTTESKAVLEGATKDADDVVAASARQALGEWPAHAAGGQHRELSLEVKGFIEAGTKTAEAWLPGSPDGEYVVVQFTTEFERKKDVIETVTPMKGQNGTWKVSECFAK